MNESSSVSTLDAPSQTTHQGSALEVLRIFTWLGFTCFGGPIAHLAYFRTEFVTKRKWISDHAYADLVGLCQFLPGPASSKLGFSIGLMRAGYAGGLAAWCGFTLPSAALMVLFAYGASTISHTLLGQGLIHGLKLVAVAIVAQAVMAMARSLCPDRQRASIAVVAAILLLVMPTSITQISAIAAGALLGLKYCSNVSQAVPEAIYMPVSRRIGVSLLVAFTVLLIVAFVMPTDSFGSLFNAFYRSGALVFGGGNVVLPLLSQAVVTPGWVSQESFLAGYGAVQAVPGPLFTFAAYLGAMATPNAGILSASIALVAIFLPGFLLHAGVLPFWGRLREFSNMQAAMRGINAAVVGVLAAALYHPVWTSAVLQQVDFTIVLAAFVLVTVWKTPPLLVVVLTAVVSTAGTVANAGGLGAL